MRIMFFLFETLLQSAKVVVLPENQYSFNHPVLLENYDKTVPSGFLKCGT